MLYNSVKGDEIMEKSDEEIQVDFANTLGELAKSFSLPINKAIVDYYNELSKTEISTDEIFLKVLQKSNCLILDSAMSYAAIFAQISVENQQKFTQALKDIIASRS